MIRVVVDSNIWVSSFIAPRGRYAALLTFIVEHGELVSSEAILAEVRDVVLRPRIAKKYGLDESTVDEQLQDIRTFTTVLATTPTLDAVPTDPDDNKIVACAVEAQAHFIISYDPHLTQLREYEGIRILTPQEFHEAL